MIDQRISDAFKKANGFDLPSHCIVMCQIGSHSHGTYVAPSDPQAIDDIDYMGVVIPPVDYLLGLAEWDHWVWKEGELDVVVYSLQKYVSLLLKSNPNVLALLWIDAEHETPAWREFQAGRMRLSSKDAYDAFSGYAYGQLKRMTAFNAERMGDYEKLKDYIVAGGVTPQQVLQADANYLKYLTEVKGYIRSRLDSFRTLHKQYFSGYMGEKRKRMVEKYGYDTKNASHLIRLMRMCGEFMATGVLFVNRTGHDAEELKAIKQGVWSLETVLAEAERLKVLCKAAKEHSTLPDKPDYVWAHETVIQMHKDFLSREG